MKWNLRLAAANRGIWKASELQRMLAEAGLVISAGKMSGLWSGNPASIKLDDLDVICAVVGCDVQELLIAEPGKVVLIPETRDEQQADASGSTVSSGPTVTPRRRGVTVGPLDTVDPEASACCSSRVSGIRTTLPGSAINSS